MNALACLAGTPAYHTDPSLLEPAETPEFRPAPLDEFDREELLIRKLGPRGWARLTLFRHHYPAGGGTGGQALSPRTLERFFQFLKMAQFRHSQPSVFLTDRGGIELCWEDRAGRSLQLEFTETGIEFYHEATAREGFVAFDQAEELSRSLCT